MSEQSHEPFTATYWEPNSPRFVRYHFTPGPRGSWRIKYRLGDLRQTNRGEPFVELGLAQSKNAAQSVMEHLAPSLLDGELTTSPPTDRPKAPSPINQKSYDEREAS